MQPPCSPTRSTGWRAKTPPLLTLLPKQPKKSQVANADIKRKVREAPEGERNNVLFQNCCRYLRRGKDPDDLVESAIASGLSPEEVAQVVASARSSVKEQRPDWYVVGEHYANVHWRGRARYVIGGGAAPRWWMYENDYWRQKTEKDYEIQHHMDRHRFGIAQELQDAGHPQAAELLGNAKAWREQQTSYPGEFWAGMAHTLKGPQPTPVFDRFAAANGLVDLRAGTLSPHAPEHETRSVAGGQFLPDKAAELRKALDLRFEGILPSNGVDWFLDLVGLAMSGKAQNWRSILWLWGPSGSGKGGIARLLLDAFGAKARVVSREFFSQASSGGDIDTPMADVIERQPLFIIIDEFGTKQVDIGRLLSRTGDTPQSARRPHGATIEGLIFAMIVVLTVTAPSIPARTGLSRRVSVLGTMNRIPDNRIYDGIPQELRDAVITLGAQRAGKALEAMDKREYHAPEGDREKKEEFMQKVDPVGMWLDTLPDSCDRMTMADLVARANLDIPDLDKPATTNLMGRRVQTSEKWRRGEWQADDKKVRGIRLKPKPQMKQPIVCSKCGESFYPPDTCCDDQLGGTPPGAATGGASDAGATQPALGVFTGPQLSLTVEIERRLTQLASFDAELRAELRADPSSGEALMNLDQCKAYRLGLEGFATVNPAFTLNPGHVAALGGAPVLLDIIQFALLRGQTARAVIDRPPDWKGVLGDLHREAVERQQEARQQVSNRLLPNLFARTQSRLKGI